MKTLQLGTFFFLFLLAAPAFSQSTVSPSSEEVQWFVISPENQAGLSLRLGPPLSLHIETNRNPELAQFELRPGPPHAPANLDGKPTLQFTLVRSRVILDSQEVVVVDPFLDRTHFVMNVADALRSSLLHYDFDRIGNHSFQIFYGLATGDGTIEWKSLEIPYNRGAFKPNFPPRANKWEIGTFEERPVSDGLGKEVFLLERLEALNRLSPSDPELRTKIMQILRGLGFSNVEGTMVADALLLAENRTYPAATVLDAYQYAKQFLARQIHSNGLQNRRLGRALEALPWERPVIENFRLPLPRGR